MLKIWHKIIYYIKQLFPCIYISTYSIDDTEFLSIWRQWFGCVLWSETYELASETTVINSKINTELFELETESSSINEECITFVSKNTKGDDINESNA